MIIKDMAGDRYKLTAKRLEEVTNEEFAWFILRSEVKRGEILNFDEKPSRHRSAKLRVTRNPIDDVYIRVPFGGGKIGCKKFSRPEFSKLLKHWKLN